MIDDVNLPLILVAAFVASASPGPTTLTIAGVSMNSGRRHGLALATGVTSVSLMWSISAAFGLAALMLANTWAFEVVRYLGASYLLFLAYKSARSALTPVATKAQGVAVQSVRAAYIKGLMLHLTNPKGPLFFGSLFSIGVPSNSSIEALAIVIAAVGIQSALVFHGYALLFSNAAITAGYTKLRRWFEAAFAVVFGAAGLKILTAPID